jgi:DNA (cytosine-5)-methyltransferase 1
MIARKEDIGRPRVVDLFAGAGLLSHAFAQEGFDVVFAVEQNAVACRTYEANLGSHVKCADVTEVQPPRGMCDVLVGGPPCQGFSTLGKRDASDPRNALSFEMVKWAEQLTPKTVVIENVAAFLGAPVWADVAERLEAMGYTVKALTLNAHDFGAPQLRSRSFTIASLHPVGPPVPVVEPVATVREAWAGLPETPDGENHHYSPSPSDLALSRMRVIPPGGDKRDVMERAPELAAPSWWGVRSAVTDVWGRMEWDRPCNTLRTALLNPSKGRYLHPEQNRVISLREAARLHSIPDEWTFVGTPYQIARQIGNSVPPALGRAVARTVLASLV